MGLIDGKPDTELGIYKAISESQEKYIEGLQKQIEDSDNLIKIQKEIIAMKEDQIKLLLVKVAIGQKLFKTLNLPEDGKIFQRED